MKILNNWIGYRKTFISLIIFFCAASLFYSKQAFAATVTWDGGGSDSNWSTASNWDTDTAPVNGDDVVLPCSAPDPIDCFTALDSDITLNSITFTGTQQSLVQASTGGGDLYTLTLAGDVTSEYQGSVIKADIVLAADVAVQNVLLGQSTTPTSTLDLNSHVLIHAGTGILRNNGSNPSGPHRSIGISGTVTGDGQLVIAVDDGTEYYLSGANNYTGTTAISSGMVGSGTAELVSGEYAYGGADSRTQHMFGASSVVVEPGGKILFFLNSGDNNASLDNDITLNRGTGTVSQLAFYNVTNDNSLVNFAVPHIILQSDNQFDAETTNGELLIDLAGIDNAGQYCVTYGDSDQYADNFQNGPTCQTDTPVENTPGVPDTGFRVGRRYAAALLGASGVVTLIWVTKKLVKIYG